MQRKRNAGRLAIAQYKDGALAQFGMACRGRIPRIPLRSMTGYSPKSFVGLRYAHLTHAGWCRWRERFEGGRTPRPKSSVGLLLGLVLNRAPAVNTLGIQGT
ncbi:hypothetical protein DF3PA_20117 [Candidatus Defluviicoccus seviourii]|uniref:Uncharacterized protein n=1 Tax=Candidatus Defluviicoccus seviourii TaxID=2565273 RepID=A0A564WCI5_9PROT|nr:hypothetical protein DF3PA_20117 [Candidatus Defluviicoccus seviourii]